MVEDMIQFLLDAATDGEIPGHAGRHGGQGGPERAAGPIDDGEGDRLRLGIEPAAPLVDPEGQLGGAEPPEIAVRCTACLPLPFRRERGEVSGHEIAEPVSTAAGLGDLAGRRKGPDLAICHAEQR